MTLSIRTVFMGTPAFAVPSFLSLCQSTSVVGVVTQPDRPAGRGRKLSPSAVKQAAQAQGVPVVSPVKFRGPELFEQLKSWAPDLIVVAAFGRILPQPMLDLPRLGCLNIHASLLPRHRGAAPIAHAIWAGDATSGVALMQMDAGLDTGAVFCAASTPIQPHETAGSLTERLAELGASLLREQLPRIVDGSLTAQPQPVTGMTLAPPLSKVQGEIDWQQPASHISRQICALSPWPGTYTFSESERVAVLGAEVHVAAGLSQQAPGTIVAISGGVVVACGEGALKLREVKPAGRGAMPTEAWARGRRLEVGHCLTGSGAEDP